jgi:hypothetical protein
MHGAVHGGWRLAAPTTIPPLFTQPPLHPTPSAFPSRLQEHDLHLLPPSQLPHEPLGAANEDHAFRLVAVRAEATRKPGPGPGPDPHLALVIALAVALPTLRPAPSNLWYPEQVRAEAFLGAYPTTLDEDEYALQAGLGSQR